MTIERFINLRGLIPTQLKCTPTNSLTYSLYIFVDERQLNKQPEHLHSVLTHSYTYYCIFTTDTKTSNIIDIHNYLQEDEALQLYLQLTTPASTSPAKKLNIFENNSNNLLTNPTSSAIIETQ